MESKRYPVAPAGEASTPATAMVLALIKRILLIFRSLVAKRFASAAVNPRPQGWELPKVSHLKQTCACPKTKQFPKPGSVARASRPRASCDLWQECWALAGGFGPSTRHAAPLRQRCGPMRTAAKASSPALGRVNHYSLRSLAGREAVKVPHLTFRAASAHPLDCIVAGIHGGASGLDEMSQGVPDAPGATITNHTQRVLPNLRRAGHQIDQRQYSGMRHLRDAPLFGPVGSLRQRALRDLTSACFPFRSR